MFGPVAVVAAAGIGAGEEGAVSAVLGFEEGDVGVGADGGAGFGGEADEGVVEGVEDEGGDADAVEDAGGGGTLVVVVGAVEAGVEGGDAVIELAQGLDVVGTAGVVSTREEDCLATKSLQHCT